MPGEIDPFGAPDGSRPVDMMPALGRLQDALSQEAIRITLEAWYSVDAGSWRYCACIEELNEPKRLFGFETDDPGVSALAVLSAFRGRGN